MTAAPKLPTIPVPTKGNADSVHETLMALKQVAEQLMGTRGRQAAIRTFVQEQTPTAISIGDLWFQSNSAHLSVWTGGQWLGITV